MNFAAARAGNLLQEVCFQASRQAGWWAPINDLDPLREVRDRTRIGKALIAEKLALAHSELSEGLEGLRKGLMDDKLPNRSMLEVELADTVIRIMDLAGALEFNLGAAIAEKMAFNATREDHKLEIRHSAGGKAF